MSWLYADEENPAAIRKMSRYFFIGAGVDYIKRIFCNNVLKQIKLYPRAALNALNLNQL
jgi:hypothetical protein